LPHWLAMRAAVIVLLLLAAGVVLVPSSGADTPARASADAAVVGGSLGDYGALDATGDGEESDGGIAVDEPGIKVGKAEVVARASRTGGLGTARAAALARHVNLFDGLVTATVARRTATASRGKTVRSGRVAGLVVEGRRIADEIRDTRTFPLSDGGSVTVNTGTAALQVTLGAARGTIPAGTRVRIAIAGAAARDAVIATPTATPAATPTAKPAKKKAKRKRAPKVPKRLTGQGYTFPVYGKATAADDFGAARADTGKHEGNDVFAPFGAPVLAVADGTVHRVGTLPISGNRLWLHTAQGDAFFYAHLSAFSPDAENGRKVKAGTVLGFTGNTGDAEPTPPHVHFEIHPGGEAKGAIDPHAILLAWQEHRDVPPGAWLTHHGADTAERPGALVEVRDFIAGE
jgi:murein DD-endopeptidase MepM/ murein hydrolase activator NlpD